MGNNSLYTIGQIAKEARVNVQTVRFYERRGILKPIKREDSGYRKYDEESLRRLHFIRQSKKLGFSLKEIQDLLGLRVRSVETCERVKAKATNKLEEIQKKITQLRELEKTMKELILDCNNRKVSDCCPILEKIEKRSK